MPDSFKLFPTDFRASPARLWAGVGRVCYAWRPAATRTGVRKPAARPPPPRDGARTLLLARGGEVLSNRRGPGVAGGDVGNGRLHGSRRRKQTPHPAASTFVISIVLAARNHRRRTASCLFVTRLWSEIQPNQIASFRQVSGFHQTSRPAGPPHSVAICLLDLRTCARRSLKW